MKDKKNGNKATTTKKKKKRKKEDRLVALFVARKRYRKRKSGDPEPHRPMH